jgi:hypothetical protein
MKHATIALNLGFALLAAPTVWAANSLVPGQVACLSLENAKNYAKYVQSAPDFAEDLLARAACYQVQEPDEAVAQGRPEGAFQAYRLLSGHQIWLPVQTVK